MRAVVILVASSRANPSVCISSSTFLGSMIASQVKAGVMDNHTFPCRAITITVASTPLLPFTETLRCTEPVYVACPVVASGG